MSLALRFLPAQDGDAIWVRWGDDADGGPHQLLIDMGREAAGRAVRCRIEALDAGARAFELLVITHVDADHIAGVLAGLAEAEPLEGLTFGDVWFNGWAHLNGETVPDPDDPDASGLESMGGAQGERLTQWLRKPWNEAFGRGPVQRSATAQPSGARADGLRLTVLGPMPTRLAELKPKWAEEVEEAIERGDLPEVPSRLEAYGRSRPVEPELSSWDDLEALADEFAGNLDEGEANGSSICLLLEWRGCRVLLTGDAFAPDVLAGLQLLGEGLPIELDLVKLAHHGSMKNVSDDLLEAIRCPRWVFSTSGARHYHPDAVAVARVLRQRRDPRPELVFNVPSEFNGWWTTPEREEQFGYTTTTGADPGGVVVTLEPR